MTCVPKTVTLERVGIFLRSTVLELVSTVFYHMIRGHICGNFRQFQAISLQYQKLTTILLGLLQVVSNITRTKDF